MKEIEKPTAVLMAPFFSDAQAEASGTLRRVDWSTAVDAKHALGDGDTNYSWTTGDENPKDCLASFDFLCCVDLETELPIDPVWSPTMLIEFFDRGKDNLMIGNGSIQMAPKGVYIDTSHTDTNTCDADSPRGDGPPVFVSRPFVSI